MSYRSLRTLLLSSLTLMFALAPGLSRAAEPAIAAEVKCDFGKDIAALRAAETDAPSEEDGDATSTPADPLTMRREILLKIVGCAEGEALALEAGLKKVTLPDEDTRRIATLLLDRVRKVAGAYGAAESKLADADAEKLRLIARDVATVRREEYLPLWDMSRAFVIWSTNRELVERAGKRLSETKQTLAARSLLEESRITDLVERASVSLLRAREADHRAAQSIERFERDRVLIYFKDTLDNLHGMYQALLNLSGTVKTIR